MFSNKYILIRNLSVIAILGDLLYWFFPFPPLFWRVALLLLSLYVIVFLEKERLHCEKAVLLFLALNLFHYFVCFARISPGTEHIGSISCAMTSMCLFSFLSKKKVLTEDFFMVLGIVFPIAAILHFYHAEALFLERVMLEEGKSITNNASVCFLFILPMIYLFKSNFQKWAVLLVCLFYLLLGAKRGNIIAAILPIIIYVFYAFKDSRRSFIKTIIVIVLILGTVYFVYQWIISNDYLMYRIEKTIEGNSSKRDVLYKKAWHVWYDSDNIGRYLFGYGFDGTIHHPLMKSVYAHSDWLEILVDYGLVGVLFYLSIFVSLFVIIWRLKSNEMKLLLLSTLLIWFFKTIYSMAFTEEFMPLLMISMGTAIGRSKG